MSDQGAQLSALPESLGQWYKPTNKRQVWLHTMFALRRELQAIEEYAALGERELLAKWSDQFTRHLRSIPEMVPEWRDAIEWDEVERLEHVVAEGALSQVSNSIDRIRRDCRSCHREFRVLAALRYRAPDFSALALDDGEGGRVDFPTHMERLSLILNRIKIASEDARWESANESLLSLRTELERLATTCPACHADAPPRARILGEASAAVLDQLATAIAARQPSQTGRQLGQAAVDICARCHATHRTLSEMRQLLFD